MAKRSYNRRSDSELIDELQDKIRRVKARIAARDREDAPMLKEMAKVTRSLKKFAQTATDHGRNDVSNMTIAFLSGLERTAMELPGKKRKKSSGAA
jgi:hypothetical protein